MKKYFNTCNTPYVVAITGASGAVYGWRLVQELIRRKHPVSLIITDPGRFILKQEMGIDVPAGGPGKSLLRKSFGKDSERFLAYYNSHDIAAPVSSGSFKTKGMLIIPCSLACLSAIANGNSKDLVERSADVTIKEKRKLILVPRETPLSPIHLENMLKLSRLGVDILPAMPGFYHRPEKIGDLVDFIVGRVLDLLNVEHDLFKRWKGGS